MSKQKDEHHMVLLSAGAEYSDGSKIEPMSRVQMPDYKPKWSWRQFTTAAFSFFCCLPACGIMGLIFASMAYVDHKTGDFMGARRKRRWSWAWTISAIVFGSIMWIIVLVVIVKVYYPLMMTFSANQRQLQASMAQINGNQILSPPQQ